MSEFCKEENLFWQNAGEGHQIFCHVPLEVLSALEPMVQGRSLHSGRRCRNCGLLKATVFAKATVQEEITLSGSRVQVVHQPESE